MLDLSKKIISYVVVFSLVLSFSTFAYADDTESDLTGDSPVSSDYVSEAELEQFDNELRSTASNLTAVLNASNSNVTYTTDDIYNLLKYYFDWDFWNHGSGTGQTWTNVTWQALSTCRERLTTINTSCNAIVTKITELANYESDIASTLGTDWNVSLRQAIDDIYQELKLSIEVDGEIVTYSVAEMLLNIQSKLNDVYSEIVSIESILANTYNVISTIKTVIDTISSVASTIATNTANTIIAVNNNTNAITTLDTHLNNIEWLDSSATYLGFNHDRSNTYVTGQFNASTYPVGYFIFTNPSLNYGRFYRFRIPVRGSVSTNEIIKSIQFTYNDNQFINPEYFDYDYTRGYVNVYCNAPQQYGSNRNIVIKVEFAYNYTILTDSYNVNYINQSDKDYYTVYEYITNLKQNRILNKFEYLYASDDLIKAKDAQQPLEDQVLQDFTGNGSASAKLSDAASAKDASSALKSGLNTGYSASDALSVFNSFQASDFGFFAWFSPENATYFNNNTNKNLLKSNMGVDNDYTGIVWTDSIPDVTSDIDRQYIEGMNNGQSD